MHHVLPSDEPQPMEAAHLPHQSGQGLPSGCGGERHLRGVLHMTKDCHNDSFLSRVRYVLVHGLALRLRACAGREQRPRMLCLPGYASLRRMLPAYASNTSKDACCAGLSVTDLPSASCQVMVPGLAKLWSLSQKGSSSSFGHVSQPSRRKPWARMPH